MITAVNFKAGAFYKTNIAQVVCQKTIYIRHQVKNVFRLVVSVYALPNRFCSPILESHIQRIHLKNNKNSNCVLTLLQTKIRKKTASRSK